HLGALPQRADARPPQLPPPRLRRRLTLDLGPVLRRFRVSLPRAPLPPTRARLLAAPRGGVAAADGCRRHPALTLRPPDRRAGRRPRDRPDRTRADGNRLHRPRDATR